MARLNELAAPMENIESLKRKFTRQNRDLARSNSTQSIRIRNLENEVARLLEENLGLRGQISHYQNELENGRARQTIEHTAEIQGQLSEKLLEISALINGLGQLPKRNKRSPRRGRITSAGVSLSPNSKGLRRNDIELDQEGRLPPILENKSYPRKTLDRQEILDIVTDIDVNISDSPEIGPPPSSAFVNEDPVKIDLLKDERFVNKEDLPGIDPSLSINLEHRRKRKDSTDSSESRRNSRSSEPGSNTAPEPSGSMRTGAKRKLSVRDSDEERETTTPVESPDDFKFTRITQDNNSKPKPEAHPERNTARTTRDPTSITVALQTKSLNVAVPTSRKVLAPKSVNNSPRKTGRLATVADDMKSLKPDLAKVHPSKERRNPRLENMPSENASAPKIDAIIVRTEPETPAGPDILSPHSAIPSTTRVESRDTPPPTDLGLSVDGHRPSRRARGAVSYAEPNLRDKMRRPTKGLTDAVIRDEKLTRTSFIKSENESIFPEVSIKHETEAENDWKTMPPASSLTVENSPLRSKLPVSETLPNTITTHRKRRESLLHQVEAETHRSSSGSAISALLAETRKAKAAAKEQEKEGGFDIDSRVTSSMSKLIIQEPISSQPERERSNSTKENVVKSRPSRRHSTIPRDIAQTDDSEASDIESNRLADASTRRRQSSLGVRSTLKKEASAKDGSERGLKRPASTTVIVEAGNGEARTDRISARRRSMML